VRRRAAVYSPYISSRRGWNAGKRIIVLPG
jgi:hypothetical protein